MEKSLLIKLFKLALITSPLIGAVNAAPIAIVVDSLKFDGILWQSILRGALIISVVVAVLWAINIALFHFNEKRRKPLKRRGIYVLSYVLVYTLAGIIFIIRADSSPLAKAGVQLLPLLTLFMANTFILVLITLMIQREEFVKLKLEKTELELQTLATMHDQLKAQIHPHFLFNCLSNLRSLIQMKDDRALHYSDLLSSFLRKSIDSSDKDSVSLKQELDFVSNYIDLQKVRFQNAFTFSVELPESYSQMKIIPIFTLQTLVENAIKHNGFTSSNPMEVVLFLEHDFLVVKNTKIEQFTKAPSTGFGLANLKERFALADLNPPIILDESDSFTVKILLK
ncbi:MAG: sensor histidine kinase [Crocinitomicaceae bacterium]